MHAIELPAKISPQHDLYLKLPDDSETGSARAIILFDSPASRRDQPGNLDGILTRLPRNSSSGLTHDEIQRRIAAERADWDDR